MRIRTLFLGTIYETPNGSLPWYNTLVWTILVTPAGFLVLGLVGAGRAVAAARREPVGMLFVAHWVFLMVLRAMWVFPYREVEAWERGEPPRRAR